ncbi:NAD(P)H-hydrate dehydratase [Hoeflea sp.]|uniref:NAD(P)H-hydrate dehydratase n=1 Tax=Hoeflea sp. TaxID=1940281 RepID=UPI003BAF0B76
MATDTTLLISPSAMGRIDAEAARSGIDTYGLMEAAGAHVAACVLSRYPGIRRAVVVCGPGNNGGDGHVAARLLAQSGVTVLRIGMEPKPGGDAYRAHRACDLEFGQFADWQPEEGDVIVDALFGAGLDRPVEGVMAALIERAGQTELPVVAVDLPSGVSGRTGRPTGPCFEAAHTVTFAALKPGHLLMPGKALCGEVHVCDIGIPARLIVPDGPVWCNHDAIYRDQLPAGAASQHKYSRGHLVVFSGPLISGGAARLSATAGLRAGAGLVSLATPPGAVLSQAAHLTAIMQRSVADADALAGWLEDKRLSAFVLGPGFGDAERARTYCGLLAKTGRPVVLDADGLSAFAEVQTELADFFKGSTRLTITPHEGEFRRLFPDLADDDNLSKIDRALAAARRLNAFVVYKGPDTVIAAPDGRAAVNADAPSWLATAGSGDVLAGLAGSLLAQGMPGFEAGCAAVALHGGAARRCGPGMTAEDLAARITAAMSDFP